MLKLNPFSPLILPCKFSILISIQFLKKLVEREFDRRSKHFPLDDHFMNILITFSFNLCIDYYQGKILLVTHGPKGLRRGENNILQSYSTKFVPYAN